MRGTGTSTNLSTKVEKKQWQAIMHQTKEG